MADNATSNIHHPPAVPPAALLPTIFTSSPSSWPGTAWLFTLLAAYLALCSALRFRREKAMRKKFNYPDRASMARMTNDDAQAILAYIIDREFPSMYTLALQYALFKTYSFPTISKLLVANKSLADPEASPKRYEDTVCIFGEFSLNPPTSERCLKAIARMNYLHSSWKAAGRIHNADLLYTLAVCVAEPIRFMRLYEWRPLNEMERCAIGTFWKSLGDAMQIEYRGYLKQDSWRDGLEFVDDITAWSKKYEVEAMVPAESNAKLAQSLVHMLFFHMPSVLRPFTLEVLTVIMGARVREAFLYPEPGIFASLVAYAALNVRRLLMRHFFLPRIFPVISFEQDPKTGRVIHWDYLKHPYYYKPTLWSRWGPIAWVTWLMGGVVPGDDGDKMFPQGFLPEDIGPANRMGKGVEETKKEEERLRSERVSGCPFAFA